MIDRIRKYPDEQHGTRTDAGITIDPDKVFKGNQIINVMTNQPQTDPWFGRDGHKRMFHVVQAHMISEVSKLDTSMTRGKITITIKDGNIISNAELNSGIRTKTISVEEYFHNRSGLNLPERRVLVNILKTIQTNPVGWLTGEDHAGKNFTLADLYGVMQSTSFVGWLDEGVTW